MKRLFSIAVAGAVVGLGWVQTWAVPCGSVDGSSACCCTEPVPDVEAQSCCEPEPAEPAERDSVCDCSISDVDATIPKAVRLVDGARSCDLHNYSATTILCVLPVDATSFHTLHSAAGPPGPRVSVARLHCSYQL